MNKYALIVAGGKGTRMGSELSKQYLEIGNKPILLRTLEVFHKTDPTIELILVLPESDFLFWEALCKEYNFQISHRLVKGGNSRFQSVKNGLNTLTSEEGVVAIHDGVRPFVNPSVILESYKVAESKGSAIAVVALKDSLRKLTDDDKSFFQERQNFRLVQTPQTFQLQKIKKAFDVTELHHFTDDATVYEHQGWQVTLISGNLENIKITTPEDMEYDSFLVSKSAKK